MATSHTSSGPAQDVVPVKIVEGSLSVSDIAIGAVELKDHTTDARANVVAGTSVVEASVAVAVKDFGVGFTTDAAVDTDTTGTVSGKLRGLVKLMVNLLSRWPAALGAGGGLKVEGVSGGTVLPTGGTFVRVADSFTRPGDTTAYAAKDVVGDSSATLQFDDAARVNAGSGTIVKAIVFGSVAAEVQRFRLHLYNTATPTLINDNTANTVLYADFAKYVGYVDFPALTTETGSSAAFAEWNGSKAFTTVTNNELWGVLETLDAYTPGNAATYSVALVIDQN